MCHLAEVIPHEVRDHDIFRALLGVRSQGLRNGGIAFGIRVAGGGALDGLADEPISFPAQEPFWAGAQDVDTVPVHPGAERGRSLGGEAVKGRFRTPALGKGSLDFATEVQFIDIPPQDVGVDPGKGLPVPGLIETAGGRNGARGLRRRRATDRAEGRFHPVAQRTFGLNLPIQIGLSAQAFKGQHTEGLHPMHHRDGHSDVGLLGQVEQRMGAQLVVADPAKTAALGLAHEVRNSGVRCRVGIGQFQSASDTGNQKSM